MNYRLNNNYTDDEALAYSFLVKRIHKNIDLLTFLKSEHFSTVLRASHYDLDPPILKLKARPSQILSKVFMVTIDAYIAALEYEIDQLFEYEEEILSDTVKWFNNEYS